MRRTVLLGAGLAIALTSLVVSVVVLHQPNHASDAPKKSPTLPPLTNTQAVALAAALRSGQASKVSQAVVMPAGTAPQAQFVAELHALKSLTVKPWTFRDNGDGTASVQTQVTGSNLETVTWVAYLVWESGKWKLSATLRSPSPSQSP